MESIKEMRASCESSEDARERLRGLKTTQVVDADYHEALAQWAQEEELPDVALREWNLALRDRPNDASIAGHLAECYLDAGKLEKAARCLKLVVQGDFSSMESWETLLEVLRQLGRMEEAEDYRLRAFASTHDSRFKNPLPRSVTAVSEDDWDDAFLVLFEERFRGREGVYARQWIDPAGQTGYSPIREPINLKAVKNHLAGNHTLGIYPLRMDNTVFFAALDLDLATAVVRNCAPGSPGWMDATEELTSYADSLEVRAREMGITLHRADSGYKGLHLWGFFAEPIPAKMARQLCKAVCASVTVPPLVRCEIFPKQSSLPQDSLGNLIKVPLGIHRKSGRRVWFSKPTPDWEAQKDYLQRASLISREQLSRCLESCPVTDIDERESPEIQALAEPADASLQTYHPDSDEEFQLLLSRCVTLRTLVAKVEHTGQLSYDEIRVLTHSVGHLASGPRAVNSLLSRCLETDPSLYLKRPLRGNPISCGSIRAKIPEITSNVACDCRFRQGAGLYPTPGLHLIGGASGAPLEHLRVQALISDFLKAKSEVHRWTNLFDRLSHKLDLWFQEAGVDEMQTSLGLLRRRLEPSSESVSFELIV